MKDMLRSKAVWLSAALLSCTALSCNRLDPCGVPGVVKLCACSGGMQGAQVCLPAKTWGACDCSGTIGLPKPGGSAPKATGGRGGGAGGGSGSGSGSGTGGDTVAAGTGGAPPSMQSGDDGGTAPMSHGGTGGSGGSSGTGGMSGAGGMGGTGGAPMPMSAAYGGCMTAADCHAGAQCITTASFPTSATVCAPACVEVADCPKPEGSYEAVLSCVTGACRLDCTPVLFAALLTCPSGMTCVAPLLGNAYCHHM
jgi:hypothetical protein